MINTYDIGDLVRSEITFTDINDVVADPTTVTVRYKLNDGDAVVKVYLTDVEVKKVDTGVYYIDIPLTATGTYYVRWEGTGVVTAAEEDEFQIRFSRVI